MNLEPSFPAFAQYGDRVKERRARKFWSKSGRTIVFLRGHIRSPRREQLGTLDRIMGTGSSTVHFDS